MTAVLVGACGSDKDADKPATDQPAAAKSAAAESAIAKKAVEKETAAAPRPKPEGDACRPITDQSLNCAESKRTSPFTCVRYNSDCSVDVQLSEQGPFMGLIAVDGIPVKTLISAAKSGCKDGPRNWKKRLAEDLSEVMKASCGTLDEAVGLTLREVDQVVEKPAVASTGDNRSALMACWEPLDKCAQ